MEKLHIHKRFLHGLFFDITNALIDISEPQAFFRFMMLS